MGEAKTPEMIERKVMEDFVRALFASEQHRAIKVALGMSSPASRIAATEIVLEVANEFPLFTKAAGNLLDRMNEVAFEAWKQDYYPPSEWRVSPGTAQEMLNLRDRQGDHPITGPSGDCSYMGIPIIVDPEVGEFALVPVGRARHG